MNETAQNEESQKLQELENARLGYETAVGLAGIVSQEIYNRFGAMLIVHALLLTAAFDYRNGSVFISMLATLVGFILCPLWLAMVLHGLFYQDRYHRIARELEEQYFSHTFRIFSSAKNPNQDLVVFAPEEGGGGLKRISAKIRFEMFSIIIIGIFWFVYAIMFWKIKELL